MSGVSGPSLWVTILAGGSGQRFWPLSKADRPKQLLPLGSARPMIVDTLERLPGLALPERTRILAGEGLVAPIREVTGLPASAFLEEPRPRGTGPVLAWAAWELERAGPGAVMVSLHADHVIDPASGFRDAVRAAAAIAVRENLLMTIAVPPDRPETGYGYLRPGRSLDAPPGHRAFRVEAFAEKPDTATAVRYIREGYRWNSGIFVWPAATFLAEIEAHAPGIARAFPLLERGDVPGFFSEVEPMSVDEGVLERSGRVGSLDATFAWDDVGTWEAFARHRRADEDGNVSQGEVHLADARGNIAVADSGRVVLLGVRDLLVVRTERETLVMPRSRSAELKRYLRNKDHKAILYPRERSGAGSG
ncbi:MAG: mannose-1-phosphate guanylyltransferase [Gemmatimonadetes bacterium]|nr:mannose-1-phosphate guanylyltransferase [Gemmatimonadota bacterium]MYD12782.1 mannose-1-phosphate guanylyltransferase [Gemmatimonadota bacterium]MYI65926.1 mannose-1-phosphate guanylyltransferase [Gemmatimonadota bacterium]